MSRTGVERATARIAVGLAITTVAALGLAGTYIAGGQSQVEGVLLALALGSLGYAFVVGSKHLLPRGPFVEERTELASTPEEQLAFAKDFDAFLQPGEPLARRKFLLRMLGAAKPVFARATRSLPQLPLMVDDEGVLRARRDFDSPVGPGFWDRDR